MPVCVCVAVVFYLSVFFFLSSVYLSRQPLTVLHVWPQGGAGVGAPGPAAASDAQRTGEHAAGQGHAHHHQVKDTDMQRPPADSMMINVDFNYQTVTLNLKLKMKTKFNMFLYSCFPNPLSFVHAFIHFLYPLVPGLRVKGVSWSFSHLYNTLS